jgi:hypothetical protein
MTQIFQFKTVYCNLNTKFNKETEFNKNICIKVTHINVVNLITIHWIYIK